MITLNENCLEFRFPQIHPMAVLKVGFERTLRVPDDGRAYPLPPTLGQFPVFHVDDYRKNLPEAWLSHGGVMLPMYPSEAMWLSFTSVVSLESKNMYKKPRSGR